MAGRAIVTAPGLRENDQASAPGSGKDGQVGASADTFTQFVALLSEHMDEPGLRSGDLAGKLFVSRSLLGRFVAAQAGQTTTH